MFFFDKTIHIGTLPYSILTLHYHKQPEEVLKHLQQAPQYPVVLSADDSY